CVPQPDDLVAAAAGQEVSFWGKRDVVDIRSMFGQCLFEFGGCRVPELDGLVAAATRQDLPIRREGDAQHRTLMPLELSHVRLAADERRSNEQHQGKRSEPARYL